MFAASDVFTVDDIVDEVLDFLTAGTQTTQYAVQSALMHFIKCKDSLERARAEFDESVMKAGSYEKAFREELTYEKIGDLTFMYHVF